MFGSQWLAGVRLRVDKLVKNERRASIGESRWLLEAGQRPGGEKKWCQARTHTVSCNLTDVLGTCCCSLSGDIAVDGSLNDAVGALLFAVLRWCGWKEMEQVGRTVVCIIGYLAHVEESLSQHILP